MMVRINFRFSLNQIRLGQIMKLPEIMATHVYVKLWY